MEEIIAQFQQRFQQAKGSKLETTYQIIMDELQSGRDPLHIKNSLHALELFSTGEKQQALREARHAVESLIWS